MSPANGCLQAVELKRKADEITAVLYPNDATEEGKELRLKQQFFFVSASLQDTIARYLVSGWSCACLQRRRGHLCIAVPGSRAQVGACGCAVAARFATQLLLLQACQA